MLQTKRDLSAIFSHIGVTQLARNDTDAALRAFEEERSIAERLASTAPDDIGLQHGLVITYRNLSTVYGRIQRKAEQRAATTRGRHIISRVLEQHPDHAVWKEDLAWFDQRLAETAK